MPPLVHCGSSKPIRTGAGPFHYDHFTIEDDNTGQVYSWEYLGMLGNRGYKRRWDEKVQWYRDNGILPHDEVPGPNGTLIITRDDPKGGTDSLYINQLIEEVFGV